MYALAWDEQDEKEKISNIHIRVSEEYRSLSKRRILEDDSYDSAPENSWGSDKLSVFLRVVYTTILGVTN